MRGVPPAYGWDRRAFAGDRHRSGRKRQVLRYRQPSGRRCASGGSLRLMFLHPLTSHVLCFCDLSESQFLCDSVSTPDCFFDP